MQLRENSIGGTRCGNRGSALQSPAAEADFTSSCGLDDDSGVVAQDRVETPWGRQPFSVNPSLRTFEHHGVIFLTSRGRSAARLPL